MKTRQEIERIARQKKRVRAILITAAILAVLIVITLFVCVKAGQASARRGKSNEAILKKLKEENELRNEFSLLTESLIKKSEPARLFKGVALNLQKKISDAVDMNAEFAKERIKSDWVKPFMKFSKPTKVSSSGSENGSSEI